MSAELSRRGMLKLMGAGALVVGCNLDQANAGVASAASLWGENAAPDDMADLNLFVAINAAGDVTIVAHRSEMGQQVRTSLPRVVADELEADWHRVSVRQATGDFKWGDQFTDATRSVRTQFDRMRALGAAARMMLEEAAARRWGVAVGECRAQNHAVVHASSGRRLGFGSLAGDAATLAPPEQDAIRLKQPNEWRYIGRSAPSVDLDDILTGKAIFGADVNVPEQRYAVIARPLVLFGKVASFDAERALATPGVLKVVEMPVPKTPYEFQPLGGIAVIAENTWAAIKGREALEVVWDHGENQAYDSPAYKDYLLGQANAPGKLVRSRGDVDGQFASAPTVHHADYYAPHMAHAAMEPPCAVADVRADSAQIWAPTQTPQYMRMNEFPPMLGLEPEAITVHTTLLGGGFGRKAKNDFVAEAAYLSKATGTPIKLIWTREDDLQHGYYHTVSAQRLSAALDDDGRVTAWRTRTAFPPIRALWEHGATYGLDDIVGQGVTDLPFNIPNMRMENCEATVHTRIGWWRSVGNMYHTFAFSSFVDELAHLAGANPKDYLLELIGPPRHIDFAADGATYGNLHEPLDDFPVDTGRLRRVIRLAADRAGWHKKRPAGRGLGIAAKRSFLSYVATVVEVAMTDDGGFLVPAVHVAIDAGTIINPDHVRAQCEGATIYGLSAALGDGISFRRGAVEQRNFDDYRVPRMDSAPKAIHVHIVDSREKPSGVGEPATPTVTPALCNAIFAASGKRIRELPIGDQLTD